MKESWLWGSLMWALHSWTKAERSSVERDAYISSPSWKITLHLKGCKEGASKSVTRTWAAWGFHLAMWRPTQHRVCVCVCVCVCTNVCVGGRSSWLPVMVLFFPPEFGFYCLFKFENGSHHVAQSGLELSLPWVGLSLKKKKKRGSHSSYHFLRPTMWQHCVGRFPRCYFSVKK
jgi:hypothetical protein